MRNLKYAPEAVESALAVVRSCTSASTSAFIGAIISERQTSDVPVTRVTNLALDEFAAASGAGGGASRRAALVLMDFEFHGEFQFCLLADRESYQVDSSGDLPALSSDFIDLLEAPLAARAIVGPPRVDAATRAWVDAIPVTTVGPLGHNFVVRVEPGGPSCADLAALLVAEDRAEIRLASNERSMAAMLIRAELHAGGRHPVIVVADEHLIKGAADGDVNDRDDGRLSRALRLRGGVDLALLGRLRCVYVWRIPPAEPLPADLEGIVAGCIGPMRFDRRSYATSLARAGFGPAGIAALQATIADPRAVAPALAVVSALADGGSFTKDDAAIFLARSHGARLSSPRRHADFDASLVVADYDVGDFLARAAHLARNGARILLVGPPASGKTTLGLELSRRLLEEGLGRAGGGEVVALAASDILASAWGATERLVHAKFEAAAAMGDAPIFVDEFDAFAGIRLEGGATSNNDGLVRALTDQLLRDLDLFASVPVVACCNDALSIDPAVRRRFHFVVTVKADLDPARERRAWKVFVGLEPPRGWRPAGAAIGDIASAAAACWPNCWPTRRRCCCRPPERQSTPRFPDCAFRP